LRSYLELYTQFINVLLCEVTSQRIAESIRSIEKSRAEGRIETRKRGDRKRSRASGGEAEQEEKQSRRRSRARGRIETRKRGDLNLGMSGLVCSQPRVLISTRRKGFQV
jgi:hypothetical protein